MDEITKQIQSGIPVSQLLEMKPLTKIQRGWLQKHLKYADFSEKIRLEYYLGTVLGDKGGMLLIQDCFKTVSKVIQNDAVKALEYNDGCHIVVDRHQVRLPLRVNWGGGWSDTPPTAVGRNYRRPHRQ